jgi:two-component system chemotaxis response regulator CheB
MTEIRKINVLVVEASEAIRTLLVRLLSADPKIQVIGTVNNGAEALQFTANVMPDLILMDAEISQADGLTATRQIMETRPLPIVICSESHNRDESITTFRLMEAGAVALVDKPVHESQPEFTAIAAQLVQTVKLMSEIKVVRRWPRVNGDSSEKMAKLPRAILPARVEAVGIGASTGGPPILQMILKGLTKNFPAPVLIVQHISPGFLEGLAEWLAQTTGFAVHLATYGTRPKPGHVYLAPDDFHMEIRSGGEIVLNKAAPETGQRPSVGRLFGSMAQTLGPAAVGVMLSGMGKDGAMELKQMKDRGALTIAQDRGSSVIYGMPAAAIALDAATFVLPADRIAAALLNAVAPSRPAPQGGTP